MAVRERPLLQFVVGSLFFLMLTAPDLRAQDDPPRVITQVTPNRVYEGQPVVYRVILRNIEQEEPQLEGFDDFEVQFVTENSSQNTIISNVNGVRTVIERRDREFVYRLVPRKTGQLTIPPAKVAVGNAEFTGDSLTLVVTPAARQDVAYLQVAVEPETVFRAQPFTVSLTAKIKSLPDPLAHKNPLAISAGEQSRFPSFFRRRRQIRPPQLEISWFDDEQIPAGLAPEKSWRDELLPLRNAEATGFRVNNIGTQFTIAMFDDGDVAFMPRPEKVQRNDADGRPTTYWEFTFTRKFVGQRVGRYDFSPVTLQGTFATKVSGGSLVAEQIFAVSNPASITVRDVPAAGRPANYINAIGKFEFTSRLAPTSAHVGDPLTLTLTLRGVGTLDEATPPDLADIPDIAEHFRLHAPSTEMRDGQRVFTYAIRPLTTEVSEFPPVSAAYFDVENERYVPMETAAIPLQITESKRLKTTDIVAAPNAAGNSADIELSEDGVFGNLTDPDSFRQDRVRPVRWFVGWGGLLGAYGLAWIVLGRFQSLQSDPARLRRRQAIPAARQQLNQARQLAAAGQAIEANSAVRDVFVGCVSDVTDESAAGLTPRELREKLTTIGVDDLLSNEIYNLLERCEAGRYGAATDSTPVDVSMAGQLLDRLSLCLKESGLLS